MVRFVRCGVGTCPFTLIDEDETGVDVTALAVWTAMYGQDGAKMLSPPRATTVDNAVRWMTPVFFTMSTFLVHRMGSTD